MDFISQKRKIEFRFAYALALGIFIHMMVAAPSWSMPVSEEEGKAPASPITNDIQTLFQNPELGQLKLLLKTHIKHRNLAADQVTLLAKEIVAFMESSICGPTAELDRMLVLQVIRQTANPTVINQGHHNTCALAALESRIYSRVPATAARIVFALRRKASFLTTDNHLVALNAKDALPDHEALRIHNPRARSYASQLFQLGAANAYWQRQSLDPRGISVPQGAMHYSQCPWEERIDPLDTCERLTISWNNQIVETIMDKFNRPLYGPAFSMDQIINCYHILTGHHEQDFLIGHENTPGIRSTMATPFNSEASLAQSLKRIEENGGFPAIISIAPKSSLNNSASLDESKGPKLLSISSLQDEWHAVAITAFDPVNQRVSIDNWRGANQDRLGDKAMTIKELFLASYVQEP